MILDSHQHFWRYHPSEYSWIDDRMRSLRRDFLPPDLEAYTAPLGISGTIAVQARQSIDETNWLLQLAKDSDLIKGVVGWAPLAHEGSKIGGILDKWLEHAKLRGLRHVLQSEPDEYFGRADFNAALRELPARGLAYDLLVFAPQLPAALQLIDRHPDLTIIVDHIAKPRVTNIPPPEWQQRMRELAKRENVYCKFSGVITEVPDWKWEPDTLRRYFDIVLNAFGPNRLMFGSDWPVGLAACSYSAWFKFVQSCVEKLTPTEQDAVMGGTCAGAYNLSL